jgi:hypothetical protein
VHRASGGLGVSHPQGCPGAVEPDLWGPYRPTWVPPYRYDPLGALGKAFAMLGAFLADVDRWHCDARGHWHRF